LLYRLSSPDSWRATRKESPFTGLLRSGLENDQLSGKFALESRSVKCNAVKAPQKKKVLAPQILNQKMTE
jgi:hypothetical protein